MNSVSVTGGLTAVVAAVTHGVGVQKKVVATERYFKK